VVNEGTDDTEGIGDDGEGGGGGGGGATVSIEVTMNDVGG